jgi:hypothetical protein
VDRCRVTSGPVCLGEGQRLGELLSIALEQAVRDVLRSPPAVAHLRPALGTDAAVLVVLKPPPRGLS